MTRKVSRVEVDIKDFQPFRNAHLEATGLTVICGENNVGKSSIFRAIDSVVNNSRHGDRDINWYSKDMTAEIAMSVAFEDGSEVTVTRQKMAEASANYTLSGVTGDVEVFEKVGRQPVEDIVTALGMQAFETRRDKYTLNFQKSREWFAVDLFGTRLFDLLNELMPQKEIVNVLSQMKVDLKSMNTDIKVKESLVESEKVRIHSIEKSIEEMDRVDGGVDISVDLEKKMGLLDTLSGLVEEIREDQKAIDIIEDKLRCSEKLEYAESLLVETGSKLDELKEIVNAVREARQAQEELEQEEKSVEAVRKEMGLVEALIEEIKQAPFDPCEAGKLLAEVRKDENEIAELEQRVEKARLRTKQAEELVKEIAPKTKPLDEANGALEDLRVAEANVRFTEQELNKLRAAEEEVRLEIEDLQRQIDENEMKCEMCGAPVDEHGKYAG